MAFGFRKAASANTVDRTWAGTEKFGPVRLASCDLRDGPVSYTHLDVYKRQSVARVRW